jgi:hypothetical protein
VNAGLKTNWVILPYTLVVFISAFLLFQIQPLIAKFILPWFGGGPSVWTVSMLFFQACLLSGYLYAHVIVRYLNFRYQVVLHIGLLCISLIQLPITPDKSVTPTFAADPTWNILALLIMEIGLPFFVLSATVPLIQSWVSRGKVLVAPYRLYALSNAASLIALLTYPTMFEPFLSRTSQGILWSFLFGAFVVVFRSVLMLLGVAGAMHFHLQIIRFLMVRLPGFEPKCCGWRLQQPRLC